MNPREFLIGVPYARECAIHRRLVVRKGACESKLVSKNPIKYIDQLYQTQTVQVFSPSYQKIK